MSVNKKITLLHACYNHISYLQFIYGQHFDQKKNYFFTNVQQSDKPHIYSTHIIYYVLEIKF